MTTERVRMRLSNLIDSLYYSLRYAIWGPEITFVDGSYVPEGRPLEERVDVEELKVWWRPTYANVTEGKVE